MIINYISVSSLGSVELGATSEERWNYELKSNNSGVDAKTLVLIKILDVGSFFAIEEEIKLFSHGEKEEIRTESIEAIQPLLDTAWSIRDMMMSNDDAEKAWLGFKF